MSKQHLEDLLTASGGSVYRLVRMASDRALEIADGKPTLIKNPDTDKVTTIALEEIAQGRVETPEGVQLREDLANGVEQPEE